MAQQKPTQAATTMTIKDETRALTELSLQLARALIGQPDAMEKACALAARIKQDGATPVARAEAYQVHDLLRGSNDSFAAREVRRTAVAYAAKPLDDERWEQLQEAADHARSLAEYKAVHGG